MESNRAPTNPRIWSQYTAGLPSADKREILARYWWPHRQEVETHIQNELAKGSCVVHVAVHSFVPVLGGTRRNADVGLLYDSRRLREKAFCRRWQTVLESMEPALRVRRNYPYPGLTDDLCTWLRRRHPTDRYVGVELEMNQALLAGKRRGTVYRLITRSLEDLLH